MADHQPYVPAEETMPEFTPSAVLLGAVLGIVFGASSLYLVLKVGMTVSASIPVAVLSITLFRGFSSASSAFAGPQFSKTTSCRRPVRPGESIAFGVGVTMPALMLLGFEMDIGRVMVVAVLGGLLGILMMIPLRASVHRQTARQAKISRRNRVRRGAHRRRKGGISAQNRFRWFRHRVCLSIPVARHEIVERHRESCVELVQGRGAGDRSQSGSFRRRLYHRHSNFVRDGSRRVCPLSC